MNILTVKCDICGRQKQEVNHWLVAIVRSDYEGIIFQPAESCADPRNTLDYRYEDICGQECAHKRLSAYLDEVNALFTAAAFEPQEG
jgi:hypothetical protein